MHHDLSVFSQLQPYFQPFIKPHSDLPADLDRQPLRKR